MTVKIIANDHNNPPGKLADAEIHFTDGPLDGLKLIGFGIWERRTGGKTSRSPPDSTRQRGASIVRAAATAADATAAGPDPS